MPFDVRDNLALGYFIDAIRDPESQRALKMADVKDLKSALVYAMKYECAQRSTRRDRQLIRGVATAENDQLDVVRNQLAELEKRVGSLAGRNSNFPPRRIPLKCWNCGGDGHLKRNCSVRPSEVKDAKVQGN